MKRFNRAIILIAVLAVTLGAAGQIVAQDSAKKKARTELIGMLVDSRCYVKMGITDGDHHECAIECLEGGIPAAVLTDHDDLYILLLPPMELSQYVNETVRVTGKVNEKHRVMVPTKIEIKKGDEWVEGKLPKSMM